VTRTIVEASAPGKLFLTGEYAVLDGAPALVAAIDRRVVVRAAFGPGAGDLVVDALAERERFVVSASLRADLAGGDVGAVLAAVECSGFALGERAAEFVVDSRPFLTGERKLGLGRSAATLVAAVAACLAADGRADAAEILGRALAANARFQDGRGSGGDVAAAVHGGVVEVRRGPAGLAAAPRGLPTGLHLVVGWTGEPAPTAPLLARFDPRRAPAALAALAAVADEAAAAAVAGDADRLLEAVDRSHDLLARLGEDTGLPIVTPTLARLVAAARRAGAAAKPSGAGAGDCGLALARSAAQAEAVRAAWREAGVLPLPLAITPDGVRHAHVERALRVARA
jgi:phosphomevalonate kinase